jgi:hypothetical protein
MTGGNYDLCQCLREISWVIGRERALYLAGQVLKWDRGGHRGKTAYLYIPKRLTPDHRLVEILGWDQAAALVYEFAGLILPISSCRGVVQRWRDSEVRQFADAGLTTQDITRIVGVSDRYVRAIKAA